MSRYFGSNQSMTAINPNSLGSSGGIGASKNQTSQKNISLDIVRMGSPFFQSHM